MYAHEIASTPADPNGAALIGPTPDFGPACSSSGWFGRYGARCSATATGPTPGPPPPCGMQNVLCRFRWLTSPPDSPGFASPSNAYRFPPATYTWAPWSWTTWQTSRTLSSYTPCVDGYVIMIAASRSACSEAFARRSSRSIVPSSLPLTTTTFMPAITAEAAFVPCADAGIRQTLRPV